eukprot:448830-Pyramimonas_sp.AAC.1
MRYATKKFRRVGYVGYRAASALEVPGVDVVSGRTLRYSRLRTRIAKMKLRCGRIRQIRRAGQPLRKFPRQAVPPALSYGVGVHGAPPPSRHRCEVRCVARGSSLASRAQRGPLPVHMAMSRWTRRSRHVQI